MLNSEFVNLGIWKFEDLGTRLSQVGLLKPCETITDISQLSRNLKIVQGAISAPFMV
jgi:hypothetical protein